MVYVTRLKKGASICLPGPPPRFYLFSVLIIDFSPQGHSSISSIIGGNKMLLSVFRRNEERIMVYKVPECASGGCGGTSGQNY